MNEYEHKSQGRVFGVLKNSINIESFYLIICENKVTHAIVTLASSQYSLILKVDFSKV